MSRTPLRALGRPVLPTPAGEWSWLVEIAAGLAASTPTGTEVGETLLLWTERYEVWRIVWAPGAGSLWHAHAEGTVALAIADGTLEERRRGGAPARRIGPGGAVGLDGGVPHRLRAVGGGPTTVIHAESPPRLGPRDDATCTLACRPVPNRLKLHA